MHNRIVLGIILDSIKIPSWSYQIISEIINSDYADIKLLILNDAPQKGSNLFSKIFGNNTFFYDFYLYLEHKFFKLENNAFEFRRIADLGEITTIKLSDFLKVNNQSLTDLVYKLKNLNLDLLLNLGSNTLDSKFSESSNYGLWTFIHNNLTIKEQVIPGFWEVMQKHPETPSGLLMYNNGNEKAKILIYSPGFTDRHSVVRNANLYYWKSSRFIQRKLKELFIKREKFTQNIGFNNEYHASFNSNNPATIPSNFAMLIILFKHLTGYIKEKFNELIFIEQWQLQYIINKEGRFPQSFEKAEKLVPPKDRFWADPDVIKKADKYYIYFEELIYPSKKAHISMMEMNARGLITKPKIILQKDYHLSFPFLFVVDKNLFMIPETSQNKTIELYECIKFPDEWILKKILMDGIIAADTNLFYHNHKWWLFTNVKENEGASLYDELFLFFSDNLTASKWNSHPQNPIVSNVKSARPAGHIFKLNNDIYRPSQNNSTRYGYGIKINKIIKLNELEYSEEETISILPDWAKNNLGTHTFNYMTNLTMIDVLIKRRRFFN